MKVENIFNFGEDYFSENCTNEMLRNYFNYKWTEYKDTQLFICTCLQELNIKPSSLKHLMVEFIPSITEEEFNTCLGELISASLTTLKLSEDRYV